MSHCQLIVDVCGGAVRNVFCSEDDAELIIVDWDIEEFNPGTPGLVELLDAGQTVPVRIMRVRASRLSELRGTMIEAALNAAEVAHGAS